MIKDIDAARAAGRFYRVPVGVTGIDPLTGEHYLTVEDAIAAFMSRQTSHRAAPIEKPAAPTGRRYRLYPWSADEDARLREMFGRGATLAEMASAIKVSSSMIHRRLGVLGLKRRPRHRNMATIKCSLHG